MLPLPPPARVTAQIVPTDFGRPFGEGEASLRFFPRPFPPGDDDDLVGAEKSQWMMSLLFRELENAFDDDVCVLLWAQAEGGVTVPSARRQAMGGEACPRGEGPAHSAREALEPLGIAVTEHGPRRLATVKPERHGGRTPEGSRRIVRTGARSRRDVDRCDRQIASCRGRNDDGSFVTLHLGRIHHRASRCSLVPSWAGFPRANRQRKKSPQPTRATRVRSCEAWDVDRNQLPSVLVDSRHPPQSRGGTSPGWRTSDTHDLFVVASHHF